MQELIGYYIPMEEYYMRESVNKVNYSVLYSIWISDQIISTQSPLFGLFRSCNSFKCISQLHQWIKFLWRLLICHHMTQVGNFGHVITVMYKWLKPPEKAATDYCSQDQEWTFKLQCIFIVFLRIDWWISCGNKNGFQLTYCMSVYFRQTTYSSQYWTS